MLLVLPVLVAVFIALLRGGSLSNLATLPLRGGSFLLGSLAVQLLLYAPGIRDSSLVMHYTGEIYIGALGLVTIGALRNWHLGQAMRIAILGLALNVSVIALNGGHMPVNAAAMAAVKGQAKVQQIAKHDEYNNTDLSSSSSKLTVLGDVIPVRFARGYGNVFSLCDMLLTGGAAAAAYGAVRRPFGSSRGWSVLEAERST